MCTKGYKVATNTWSPTPNPQAICFWGARSIGVELPACTCAGRQDTDLLVSPLAPQAPKPAYPQLPRACTQSGWASPDCSLSCGAFELKVRTGHGQQPWPSGRMEGVGEDCSPHPPSCFSFWDSEWPFESFLSSPELPLVLGEPASLGATGYQVPGPWGWEWGALKGSWVPPGVAHRALRQLGSCCIGLGRGEVWGRSHGLCL